MIEQKINELFGDADSTGVGTGWWSGVLSVFLGFLSFGAVLCLRFPQLLTVPQFRPHYPMQAIRTLIQCLIVGAAVFGILSSILRRKKVLALTGLLLAMTAAALGGSTVRINEALRDGPAIGLDWFLLDLLLTAVFFCAPRKALAATQGARNVSQPVDIGCGLLHVHSSPYPDFVVSGFIARHPSR